MIRMIFNPVSSLPGAIPMMRQRLAPLLLNLDLEAKVSEYRARFLTGSSPTCNTKSEFQDQVDELTN
jgi:hypothetical protein